MLTRKKRAGNVQLHEAMPYVFPAGGNEKLKSRPVVVGCGPAGLFCAYFLAEYGYQPVLLEQGAPVEERQKDVEEFWKTGVLKPDSNVQFGEGGAGTFSDGKLNTLIKDPVAVSYTHLDVYKRQILIWMIKNSAFPSLPDQTWLENPPICVRLR